MDGYAQVWLEVVVSIIICSIFPPAPILCHYARVTKVPMHERKNN